MWRHIKPILQVIILATAMFVSSFHSLVLGNTTNCPRTFKLVHYHNTKLQLSDKNNSTHTWVKFKMLLGSINPKFLVCFVEFSPYRSVQKEPRSGAKSCLYKSIPRRANPVYRGFVRTYIRTRFCYFPRFPFCIARYTWYREKLLHHNRIQNFIRVWVCVWGWVCVCVCYYSYRSGVIWYCGMHY